MGDVLLSIPPPISNELHGEEPQFVVRERRAISRRTLQHYVVGCGAFVVVFFIAGARGLPDLMRYGFLATGIGWGLTGLVAWVLPGGTVVGTQTRLLRVRSFGIGPQVVAWREFRGARQGKDGSVELDRIGRRPGRLVTDDIAAPEPRDGLATLVASLVEKPVREATKVRSERRDHRFSSTHTPAKPGALMAWVLGGVLACFGLVVMGVILFLLARASVDSGDDAPAPAWAVPFLVGLGLFAVGLGLSMIGRTRRRPVDYVATARGLEIHPTRGKQLTIPWEDFEGSYRRVRRWGREELRFPLRTTMPSRFVRGAQEQQVLRIVGVRDPDAVAAELLRRIQA